MGLINLIRPFNNSFGGRYLRNNCFRPKVDTQRKTTQRWLGKRNMSDQLKRIGSLLYAGPKAKTSAGTNWLAVLPE